MQMPYQSSALQVHNVLISCGIYFSNRAQHFYVTFAYGESQTTAAFARGGHLSLVAIEKTLNVLNLPIKELNRHLQPQTLGSIGHKVLDPTLCVLTPPFKAMDAEETTEPYDEPWCKPLPPIPKSRQIKNYPLCRCGSDADKCVLI